MADAWDDDDFEPTEAVKGPAVVSDKWDGEDEDDNVKDSWDKSSDEGEEDPDKPKAIQRKKKKKLAEIIAEKEAAKEAELERKAGEAAAKKQMNTPEAKLAEKIRLQKMEENSNLMLAKDMMGLKLGSIDNMVPVDKADFVEFEKALTDKITMFSTSTYYADFVSTLIKNLMLDQPAAVCKKVKMDAEALHATKLKEEKAVAAKAKKGKGGKSGTLRMDTNKEVFTANAGADFDEFDEFM